MKKIAYREGHKDMIHILNDNFESFDAAIAGLHSMTLFQIADTTIPTSGWTLLNGLYYYRLAISQILINSYVELIPFNTDLATVQAMQLLPQLVSNVGYFDFYAKNAPTAIFHVTINIWTP